jgi:hypothetical protein
MKLQWRISESNGKPVMGITTTAEVFSPVVVDFSRGG